MTEGAAGRQPLWYAAIKTARTLGMSAPDMMQEEDASPLLWLRRAVAILNIEAEVTPILQERARIRAESRR